MEISTEKYKRYKSSGIDQIR